MTVFYLLTFEYFRTRMYKHIVFYGNYNYKHTLNVKRERRTIKELSYFRSFLLLSKISTQSLLIACESFFFIFLTLIYEF